MKVGTQPRPKCWNCKYASEVFRAFDKPHCHCFDPTQYPEEEIKAGKWSPWDTLREGWDTCDRHQFQQPATKNVAQ